MTGPTRNYSRRLGFEDEDSLDSEYSEHIAPLWMIEFCETIYPILPLINKMTTTDLFFLL